MSSKPLITKGAETIKLQNQGCLWLFGVQVKVRGRGLGLRLVGCMPAPYVTYSCGMRLAANKTLKQP